MRKFIIILALAMASTLMGAQSTAVSLNVTDADGQTWNNGTWSVTLVPTPGATGGPYFIMGTVTPVPNQLQSGTLDGSGNVSLTLTPNTSIAPSKSLWRFTVCSGTNPTVCSISLQTITGASQSVNLVPDAIRIQLVNPIYNYQLYQDVETVGAMNGSLYWNLSSSVFRQFANGVWSNLSGGGGGGTPGGANLQMQFNNSGAFGGLSYFITNPTFPSLMSNAPLQIQTTDPKCGSNSFQCTLGTLTGTGLDSEIYNVTGSSLGLTAGYFQVHQSGGTAVGQRSIFIDTPDITGGTQSYSYGLHIGDQNPANKYGSSSAAIQIDSQTAPGLSLQTGTGPVSFGDTTTAPTFNATSGFQVAGVALSSTNLSDSSHIVRNNQANTYSATFLQDFNLAKIKLPLSTVAALPSAASSTNMVYVITNGASSSDCTTGGGTSLALCTSNGTAWVALGGAAGSGTVTNTAGALTANCVTIGNAGNDIKCSANTTDNGTTLATTNTGGISAPLVTTTGTNGGIKFTEGTGAGVTTGTGIDGCWGDSTAHSLKCNLNNVGATFVPYISTATLNALYKASNTTGGQASSGVIDDGTTVSVTGESVNFSGASHTQPVLKGLTASKPATCTQGEVYFATDATAGANLFYCTATNTWTQQASSSAPNSLDFSEIGANPYTPTAGFDQCWGSNVYHKFVCANNAGSQTVIPQLSETSISANAELRTTDAIGGVATGILQDNGTTLSTTGAVDFSGASHTQPVLKGTAATKPATCTQGEIYFATDATAGQNLYFCTTANTWTQQLNSGGGGTNTQTMPVSLSASSSALVVNTTYELNALFSGGWTSTSGDPANYLKGNFLIPPGCTKVTQITVRFSNPTASAAADNYTLAFYDGAAATGGTSTTITTTLTINPSGTNSGITDYTFSTSPFPITVAGGDHTTIRLTTPATFGGTAPQPVAWGTISCQ